MDDRLKKISAELVKMVEELLVDIVEKAYDEGYRAGLSRSKEVVVNEITKQETINGETQD